jgi:hypothetical protein
MSHGPFFTELDQRAEIKGSRDPLGTQPIWTRLGRRVVGNLTTVSDSLRDFTLLLFGLYLADQATGRDGAGADLGIFLKWEQLAAYARAAVNHDWRFRGVEQVRKRLDSRAEVVLSQGSDGAILSDQKTYGLWGLYTMPARASGLVRNDANALTRIAFEFVEREYLPIFKKYNVKIDALCKTLGSDRHVLRMHAKDQAVTQATANLLLDKRRLHPREPEFYREHVLFGGPSDSTRGVQRHLADLLSNGLGDAGYSLSPTELMKLAQRARKSGAEGEALGQRLDDIRIVDAAIGPMALLFPWILGANGQTVDRVGADLRKKWGKGLSMINVDALTALREFLPSDADLTDCWLRAAVSARAGEYEALVRELIVINAHVMRSRGAAPWVALQGDRIDARFQEDSGSIPDRAQLTSQLVFPYFITSLRAIAKPLRST